MWAAATTPSPVPAGLPRALRCRPGALEKPAECGLWGPQGDRGCDGVWLGEATGRHLGEKEV